MLSRCCDGVCWKRRFAQIFEKIWIDERKYSWRKDLVHSDTNYLRTLKIAFDEYYSLRHQGNFLNFRQQMCFSSMETSLNWETWTWAKLWNKDWLTHKQGLLTMLVLKFGKTDLMTSNQTFGVLGVWFMKQYNFDRLFKQQTWKDFTSWFLKVIFRKLNRGIVMNFGIY